MRQLAIYFFSCFLLSNCEGNLGSNKGNRSIIEREVVKVENMVQLEGLSKLVTERTRSVIIELENNEIDSLDFRRVHEQIRNSNVRLFQIIAKKIELPKDLKEFKSIKWIILSASEINIHINSFKNFCNLRSLELHVYKTFNYPNLVTFPENMSDLSLEYHNEKIPDFVYSSSNLTSLKIINNDLIVIDNKITALTKLRLLDICNTPIPKRIQEKNMESAKVKNILDQLDSCAILYEAPRIDNFDDSK